MKVKKYTLENPVSLKVCDMRALYLLWHFFNNTESVGKGGFKESVPKGTALHLEATAKEWHESAASGDFWTSINDLCNGVGLDVNKPLELWKAPPLPTISTDLDTYTVNMPNPDAIKIGCKTFPLSEIEKLVSVLLNEKVIELPKAD